MKKLYALITAALLALALPSLGQDRGIFTKGPIFNPLAGGAITGTTITATTQFLAPYGSAAAPAYAFSSDATTGIYGTSGSVLGFSTGGTFRAIMGTGAMLLADTFQLGWNTDLRLTRYAAKQLMISGDGTGATTNAGLTAGYAGSSGYGGIVSSGDTLSTSSYSVLFNNGSTWIGTPSASGVLYFFPSAAGSQKMAIVATQGAGPSITAGTATTDVNALSLTQTWNAAGVAFNAIDLNVTNTASAAGANLMRLRLGGTAAFTVGKNNLTLGAAIVTPASSGTRYLCIDTSGVVTSSASACSGT